MKIALVAFGGAIGSVLRYFCTHIFFFHAGLLMFPWGTFIVNLTGSFIIGIAAALSNAFSPETRLFIFTGCLGGFTTFSSVAIEGFTLIRTGEPLKAILYILLSNAGGILLAASGYILVNYLRK